MATPPTTTVKEPLSTLEALVLSLISAAAGVGVGFGAIGTGTAGNVTAVAGIVGGALLQVAAIFDRKDASAERRAGVR